MSMKLMRGVTPARMIETPHIFEVQSDFQSYSSGGDFSTSATASVTATTQNISGGVLQLNDVPAAANDECYIYGTSRSFLIAAGLPLIFETRFQYQEKNTAYLNIIMGFMGTVASGALVTTSGGPKVNDTEALIFKVGNASTIQPWQCQSQIGNAVGKTTTVTNQTPDSSATNYHTYTIEIRPIDSTLAEIEYFYDGVPFLDNSSPVARPFKHILTYTNAVQMTPIVGFRTGATASTAEILNIDYIYAAQMKE